jgi:hypothetical protein
MEHLPNAIEQGSNQFIRKLSSICELTEGTVAIRQNQLLRKGHMGLFTSLFPPKVLETNSDINEVFVLIGDLRYGLAISGTEHRQKTLEAICGPRKRGGVSRLETAWLILEDKNSTDKNAVRVEIRGRTVGYLSSEAAIGYRQQLIERNTPGADGKCQALITGGWISSDGRKGSYEVRLDAPGLTH